jgi:formylglycine-generating enzyme required for sulfatase activity
MAAELEACGFHVVDEAGARQLEDVDVVVCVDAMDAAPVDAERWMSVVNRSRRDVLLTAGRTRVVPAANTLLLGAASELGAVARQVRDIVEHDDDGSAVPRLLEMPQDASGDIPADWRELHLALQDARRAVVPVTTALLQSLRDVRATSRAQYDVVRFVRWAHDRLDQSFVNLRMRVADSPSSAAAVTAPATALSSVLDDPRSSNLVVLKGAPGAGKSLQLRRLETHLALNSIRSVDSSATPMPFCVALGEHATYGGADPLEWLSARWARRVSIEHMQNLRYHIESGTLVLMLDGFNELPFSSVDDRRHWMLKWRAFIHDTLIASPHMEIVVASRTRDLTVGLGSSEVPQTVVEMLPLEDAEIREIARRRNPLAARRLTDVIDRDPTAADLYRSPFSLTDFLATTEVALDVPRSQSEIFLFRIRHALEHEREQNNFRVFDVRWLPESAVANVLAETSSAGLAVLYRSIPLTSALGRLARDLTQLGLEERSAHTVALELGDARRRLSRYLDIDEAGAEEALYVAIDLGLLQINEGVVRFRHHSLQEFFAATTLQDLDLLDAITVAGGFEGHLGPLETVLDQLGPSEELPIQPVTGFEQTAARAAELRPRLLGAMAPRNPWLAAEIIVSGSVPDDPEIREAVVDRLYERVEVARDWRERITTWLLLGRLASWSGNQLIGTMVPVPPDVWNLGCDDATTARLGSARPRKRVELPAFAMGAAPVTNAEFRRFVSDGGYGDRSLWCAEGWRWRTGAIPPEEIVDRWRRRRDGVAARRGLGLRLMQEGRASVMQAAAITRFAMMSDEDLLAVAGRVAGRSTEAPACWDDERFNNPLQPVIGICPFECDAYCRWLSRSSGRSFRLPSEDEWEAFAIHAARLTGEVDAGGALSVNDISPSDRWSSIWGNTAELHLGKTAPVGAFSDMGHPADVIGNVFEWVSDRFEMDDPGRRVCKGGSWRHLIPRAVPGYRGRGDVTTRNDDLGFRVLEELGE